MASPEPSYPLWDVGNVIHRTFRALANPERCRLPRGASGAAVSGLFSTADCPHLSFAEFEFFPLCALAGHDNILYHQASVSLVVLRHRFDNLWTCLCDHGVFCWPGTLSAVL